MSAIKDLYFNDYRISVTIDRDSFYNSDVDYLCARHNLTGLVDHNEIINILTRIENIDDTGENTYLADEALAGTSRIRLNMVRDGFFRALVKLPEIRSLILPFSQNEHVFSAVGWVKNSLLPVVRVHPELEELHLLAFHHEADWLHLLLEELNLIPANKLRKLRLQKWLFNEKTASDLIAYMQNNTLETVKFDPYSLALSQLDIKEDDVIYEMQLYANKKYILNRVSPMGGNLCNESANPVYCRGVEKSDWYDEAEWNEVIHPVSYHNEQVLRFYKDGNEIGFIELSHWPFLCKSTDDSRNNFIRAENISLYINSEQIDYYCKLPPLIPELKMVNPECIMDSSSDIANQNDGIYLIKNNSWENIVGDYYKTASYSAVNGACRGLGRVTEDTLLRHGYSFVKSKAANKLTIFTLSGLYAYYYYCNNPDVSSIVFNSVVNTVVSDAIGETLNLISNNLASQGRTVESMIASWSGTAISFWGMLPENFIKKPAENALMATSKLAVGFFSGFASSKATEVVGIKTVRAVDNFCV